MKKNKRTFQFFCNKKIKSLVTNEMRELSLHVHKQHYVRTIVFQFPGYNDEKFREYLNC